MRWKAFFYLNPDKKPRKQKETFGFKSRNTPPQVAEMTKFEDDLLQIIENIEFTKSKCHFQSQLRNDVKKIQQSDEIFVPADKTNNFYKLKKDDYDQLLRNNTTSKYTRTDNSQTDLINAEAKQIAEHLLLDDRIDTLAQKPAFITIKDHKENFPNHVKCRLINPAKSDIGVVSKNILDRINKELINATSVKQWKNTQSAINWFKSIDNAKSCSFLVFDVVEFYPSITQDLLNDALDFAAKFTQISDRDRQIINHAKKTLLFHDNSPWNKSNPPHQFDVTMGSYDGAETCELVGSYILYKIRDLFDGEVGLYRDDGLAILRNKSLCDANRLAKRLHEEFAKLGLRITVDQGLKVINFLDVTLNLNNGSYRPYMKPNNQTKYVNKKSNHPRNIIKAIPSSMNQRLSNISSDIKQFNDTKKPYQDALKDAGYDHTLEFNPPNNDQNASKSGSRKRKRNIVWYNPPFSKHVSTNVGRKFLNLIDKHFPKGHILHKLFNRNNVKVSYCCMKNMSRIIKTHNESVIQKSEENTTRSAKTCNCRKPNLCPLMENCLVKSIIYKATVTTDNDSKSYIGLCETDFKSRWNNHKSSFKHEHKRKETALSKHVWDLKDNKTNFNIKWSILKKTYPYTNVSKKCHLCLWEKYFIITADKSTS